jgi:hypothetical protein
MSDHLDLDFIGFSCHASARYGARARGAHKGEAKDTSQKKKPVFLHMFVSF